MLLWKPVTGLACACVTNRRWMRQIKLKWKQRVFLEYKITLWGVPNLHSCSQFEKAMFLPLNCLRRRGWVRIVSFSQRFLNFSWCRQVFCWPQRELGIQWHLKIPLAPAESSVTMSFCCSTGQECRALWSHCVVIAILQSWGLLQTGWDPPSMELMELRGHGWEGAWSGAVWACGRFFPMKVPGRGCWVRLCGDTGGKGSPTLYPS